MRFRVLCLILAGLALLALPPGHALAQDGECLAIVYYYEATGRDEGQCLSVDTPCQTLEYALEQGQRLCPTEVGVFYANPNNISQRLDWRPPPASTRTVDTLWLIGRWLGPVVGVVLGWLVAWLWVRRLQGGVA